MPEQAKPEQTRLEEGIPPAHSQACRPMGADALMAQVAAGAGGGQEGGGEEGKAVRAWVEPGRNSQHMREEAEGKTRSDGRGAK